MRRLLLLILMCILAGGCTNNENETKTEVQKEETEDTAVNTEEKSDETILSEPTKEEVLAMRETVLEGMSQDDIERMKTAVIAANLRLESGFLNSNLERRLSDPGAAVWNYLEQTGEIIADYGIDIEIRKRKDELGLTERELEQQYGVIIWGNNAYDAERIIGVLEEIKETIYNEDLICDFNRMIENVQKAKDTHDGQYIIETYHILHDMDYYLFRYGLEDVGVFVEDRSTLKLYYGELTCYQ